MVRIEKMTTEELLQMELTRRSMRTLARNELLAIADQLLWAQCHQKKLIKGLTDRIIELELEHHRWAEELLQDVSSQNLRTEQQN